MQRLISEIAESHGITFDSACSLVERAASSSLSGVMRIDAYARYDGEVLGFFRFDPDRGEVQIRADHIHQRVIRRMRHEINKLMLIEDVSAELQRVRRILHTVVAGRIRALSPSGVYANIETSEGGVTAYCPSQAMMAQDKPKFGQRMKWYVTKVGVKPGNPQRVDVLLSRTSKEFVTGLLREKSAFLGDQPEFRVTRRIPGQFSEVEALSFIPPYAIQTVARELGERIIIKRGK